MVRTAVLFVAAAGLIQGALTIKLQVEGRSLRSASGAKLWPFSGGAAWPFHAAAVEAPTPAAEKGPSIADVKDNVMLSAAFGKKTEALCNDAGEDERVLCRQLAGERLFCALLKRHESKYQGFVGLSDEKAKCRDIDIMETTQEAAKDAMDQQEAAKA
eukprot:SRR837773.10970.p2 GENE.SRR837773.10970~~SRR837773.10970.p2  ORF type:complete len:158 (+),score=68.37 SRR837773.10970:56-529(+)